MEKKEINDDMLLALEGDQLEQLLFATNDGQGDTSVHTLKDLRKFFNTENSLVAVDEFYKDTCGNMTVAFWIENNKHIKVRFKS